MFATVFHLSKKNKKLEVWLVINYKYACIALNSAIIVKIFELGRKIKKTNIIRISCPYRPGTASAERCTRSKKRPNRKLILAENRLYHLCYIIQCKRHIGGYTSVIKLFSEKKARSCTNK